jgi:hypothetical protein
LMLTSQEVVLPQNHLWSSLNPVTSRT